MEYIKFTQDKNQIYQYTGASSIGISILGIFLESDTPHFLDDYRNWALTDKNDPNAEYAETYGGNCTNLEDDNGTIYLEDQYSEEEIPTRLKMSREQFVKILDEWEQKVVKADPKPKEIIIKQDGDQFFIETK